MTKDNNYYNVHQWLRHRYGNANKCESPECEGKSKTFQWALLKGKSYKHNRENFWMLCRSCHRKYDMTKEWNKKISKANKGRKFSEQHRKNIAISSTGRIIPTETKTKMSKSITEWWRLRKLKSIN